MLKSKTLFIWYLAVIFTICYAGSGFGAEEAQTCDVGSSQRVIITNNCADPAYVIITPPASDPGELWSKVGTNEKPVNGFIEGGTQYYKMKIAANSSQPFCIPNGGIASGNFKFYLGCDETKSDESTGFPVDCAIGGQPGHVDFPVSSKFEFTAGCKPGSVCTKNPSDPNKDLGPMDYFDISNVDGYNVPMSIEETGTTLCTFQSMESITDLWSCPGEDWSTISTRYNNPQLSEGINLFLTHKETNRAACATFEKWLEVSGEGQHPINNITISPSNGISTAPPNIQDWYSCNVMPSVGADDHPSTCTTPGCGGPQCAVGPDGTTKDYSTKNLAQGKGKPYTNYVKRLKATGNQGYAWQFNDDASTMRCPLSKASSPVITLTLCPGESGQKPYQPQKWAFTGGKCVIDKKNGVYASLWDCQVKNVKFTCKTEVVQKFDVSGDHAKDVKAELNYCMPVDMTNSVEVASGLSWSECNNSFCQERGDCIDVCILNKLEENYPEYLHPPKTPSIKIGDFLYRYYANTNTYAGLCLENDSEYSNKVLYIGSDDQQVHIIGTIDDVAGQLGCR